jgi:hypothetical protein
MQRTADFHDQVSDTRLPEEAGIMDDAAALDAAVDVLDAYVVGCSERETVYRQHTQFVADYQFWGHWAHKRTDAQGRIFYLAPEVVLGHAHGRAVEPGRLQRTFRLRHRTRIVRAYSHIRLHNFGST